MVRVLFLNENIGGHETVHRALARALDSQPDVDARFVDVPKPGLARRLVGAPVPGLARLDLDLQPLRSQLALSAAARRLLAREAPGCDLLHVYTHNAALLSVNIVRRYPTVVTLDTTNALNAYRLPYRHPTRFTPKVLPLTIRFERRVYDAADVIVAKSEWAASSLRSDYGVADDHVRVIPFGVTIPDDPARLPLQGVPRVTFIGRQLERKGGLRLLDLYERRLRDLCSLTLVTMEEPRRVDGVEVVNDLKPGDPHLWDVLRRTSVFVFPSQVDQAPNAVLEAMAAGVPVVALRVGGLAEMVEHGVTGTLVDPDDDDDVLVEAIAEIVSDPDRQAAMGAAGRARACERFDMDLAARRLVRVFEEVLA